MEPEPSNKKLSTERRKSLRKDLTPAEAALWTYLKSRQLNGRKFRRQHSVGPYFLDFFCPQESLAVELDGDVHFNQIAAQRDHKRSAYLASKNIKVIRFENYLVFDHIQDVLKTIRSHFREQDDT